MVRSIAAVGIGCDVLIGGIFNCGVSGVAQLLHRLNHQPVPTVDTRAIHFAKMMISKYSNHTNLTVEALMTYASAFAFEKTAEGSFHGSKPSSLEKYLESFKEHDTINA